MPKKPLMRTAVYNYVLDYFKNRYEESQAFRIRRGRPDDRKFPTVESIVNFVLENDQLAESNTGTDPEMWQTSISRGTIRNAVNDLIEQHKITLVGESYEFVPHMEKSLAHHPILEIADKINISIGVPNEMIVLSVPPEHAVSISNYLSALFYKGDIIFIPITGKILCISVLPESMLNVPSNAISTESLPVKLRERIEMAIHQFDYHYPKFTHGSNYEMEYHVSHNSKVVELLANEAKKAEEKVSFCGTKNIFKDVQQSIYLTAEYANNTSPLNIDPESGLSLEAESALADYSISELTQEEWDLMDSSIMDKVDDEFDN